MEIGLFSLVQSPPPGFDFIPDLTAQKLIRRPFCLLVPDATAGTAFIGQHKERALGLVVDVGEVPAQTSLGMFCRQMTIPPPLLPWLREFAIPQLEALQVARTEWDRARAREIELDRHQRDRERMARDHLDFRNSLVLENAERRKAEEATAAANEIYRSVFRAAISHAIIGTDSDGIISIFSEGAERLLGYSAAEMVGRASPILIHDPYELAARAFELGIEPGFEVFTKRALEGEVETHEWTYVRKDGHRFPVQLSVSVRRDGRGRVIGFLGVASDITERKAAEEQVRLINRELESRVQERTADLSKTNAFIRATLESMTEGILAVDLHGRLTWFNERFLRICCIPPDRTVSSLDELTSDFFLPCIRNPEAFARREQERHERPENDSFDVLEFKDGRTLERCSRPQRIGQQIVGQVWSYRDITERRKLESQLQQAQKLEAVGQLAAGIAHELNTPAQFVGDNLSFIKSASLALVEILKLHKKVLEKLSQNSEWEESLRPIRTAEEAADLAYLEADLPTALDSAEDGIARMAAIVQAMKEFAHPGQREAEYADLNRAIQATLTIARNEYKYVADAVTELKPLPPVLCHLGDLNQVFLNLIVNAAHAIGDRVEVEGGRGRICVRTDCDQTAVRIQVEDTGSGIAPEIRSRVFDPFFTTKPVGKGSGQGLAISHAIVVGKHGGALTFETEVGKGTTFIITLPISGVQTVEQQTP